MARMLTAADVEAAAKASQGLLVAPGDRLTPLARDRAKELGVALQSVDAPQAAATPSAPASASVTAPVASAAVKPAGASAAGTTPPSGRPFVLPPSGAMYRRNALGPKSPAGPARDGRPKAGVVGAGHVGATAAYALIMPGLSERLRETSPPFIKAR
jgi:malate dehydrogenase